MKSKMVSIFLCVVMIASVFGAITLNLGLLSMNASGEGSLEVEVTSHFSILNSAAQSAITVHITDGTNPVQGANVNLTTDNGGLFSPQSGTTDINGNFTSIFNAPTVTTQMICRITAQANKTGYNNGSGFVDITINPIPWPMFSHNCRRTGISPYDTNSNPGTLKWSYTTSFIIQSSPVIDSDETIYIRDNNDVLYAIYPNGIEKWKLTLPGEMDAIPTIGSDGTIYIGSSDNKFYAFNPDGTEKWNVAVDGSVVTSAAIGSDGTVYFGTTDFADLYAINSDGTEKWRFMTGGGQISPPGIGSDGTIYFGSSDDDKLHAVNPDGTEKWNFTANDNVQSAPAIDSDGTIYVGSRDKNLYAFNPNGTEKWRFKTGGSIGWHTSAAIGSDGTIYIDSSDKNLYAINPNGTEKWRLTTSGGITTAPAIDSAGTIYVGSNDNNLYAINPDGTEKWNFMTGWFVHSTPAIGSDGTIYFGSADSKLYAIGTPNIPPVAEAGPDQTVNEGDVVSLDGSGSIGGTPPPGITPPADLVSWWPGDWNASDIIDGNHGTLLDGTTFDAGKVGQAFSFDGVNDRVSVPDSDNLKITDSLTIDAWIYIESFPSPSKGAGQILFRGDDRNSLDPYYLTTLSNGKIRFHIESLTNAVNLETPILEDQFVLVAATLDNATGLMRIYINGTVAAETITDVRPFRDLEPSFNPGVGIGNHAPSAIFNQPFHGLIDELEIFNRALNASEIQDLFNADSAGKCKGFEGKAQIISYEWDFESDGIYDYQETPNIAPDGAFDGKTTHIYGDNGVYTVTLRVTDETGANDTDTCIVTVNNLAPNIEPFGPFIIEEGATLKIDANATDPGSDDLNFTWDWGDGTSDTISVYYNNGIDPDPYPSPFGTYPFFATDPVQYIYRDSGVYTINLTVEDDDGGITIYTTIITVIGISPPTLYINESQDGEDVILYWDPPSTPGIDHYLIYRSTSQTGFDFNTIWVNTSSDNESGEPEPIPLRTMWNDTNASVPGNSNFEEQYYYIIRATNTFDRVSRTSRTVGKWTKTFPQGVSTFSIPLEPLVTMNTTIDYYLKDMNATYIKWMDPINYIWMKYGDGSVNDTQMKVGEGYEIAFDSPTNYTFLGMPGAMIRYKTGGFTGFDYNTIARNLTAIVDPITGNVTLYWTQPSSMDGDDSYKVYRSTTRDGFDNGTIVLLDTLPYGNETYVDPGAAFLFDQCYYMVIPANETDIEGSSTYSIGIWTEEYLSQYDTFGIPLKLSNIQTADWYCDNIPDTVGINYYNVSAQRWSWHSTRMPKGAFDPILVMTIGYQISTSSGTEFTYIGI